MLYSTRLKRDQHILSSLSSSDIETLARKHDGITGNSSNGVTASYQIFHRLWRSIVNSVGDSVNVIVVIVA